jgi:hypothetical protein
LEEPGDCYFQLRKNIYCNYENIGGHKWTRAEESDLSTIRDEDLVEYNKHFCENCYITATIGQSNSDTSSNSNDFLQHFAIFSSPMIDKSKKYLSFNYKLSKSALLKVKFIYENDYLTRSFEKSIVIRTINDSLSSSNNDWKEIRLKLGNKILDNYRILFELDRSSYNLTSNDQATASIDNIVFLKHDLKCTFTLNNVCINEENEEIFEKSNSKNNHTSLLLDASRTETKFCQKYSTPCEMNKCQNGAVCLNREQLDNSLNIFLNDNNEKL